jgi:branched-subunit amino acid transport protein
MGMHRNTWLRILEFVVAGILFDLVENTVVFKAAAGRTLALEEIGVAALVIVPFAVLSELIIDHPRFWHRLFRWKGNKFDHLDLK